MAIHETIDVWYCEFCPGDKEPFYHPREAEEHESECPYNPEVQACQTCRFASGLGTGIADCALGILDDQTHYRIFCSKWKSADEMRGVR